MPVKPAASSLEHKSYWKSAYSLLQSWTAIRLRSSEGKLVSSP